MPDILRNEFSWSVSRDRVFDECPREYYYHYYGSWGGWEDMAPERVREIYVLKQLKHRPMWIGEVVHDCIRHSLRNLSRGIPVIPLPEILSITRDRMRTDFRNSRDKRYWRVPKLCGLFEHEYEVPVSDDEWRATAAHVDRCLETFYRSEAYAQLAALRPDDFLEVEELRRFELDGFTVNIKLDCAIRETDRIVVWDWKTGRRESAGSQLQMACYAYYASTRYGIPVHRVTPRRFELYTGTVHEDALGERALDELLGYIRGSIKDMRALLDEPERNLAREERFTQVARREICARCSFLRVCQPPLPPAAPPHSAR
ncbi:MAG: PD-(D/E)XK nuclease family protein [Candidatus Krumholzibacteria bacterium]|nr:PD-(D/E)XK nuclease family protein [Candidatus Krumholzibacteria bacterium]